MASDPDLFWTDEGREIGDATAPVEDNDFDLDIDGGGVWGIDADDRSVDLDIDDARDDR